MKRNATSPNVLCLAIMTLLTACVNAPTPRGGSEGANPAVVCPAYPPPSPEAVDELGARCWYPAATPGQDPESTATDLCPHVYDWIARLDRLAEQLDVCRAHLPARTSELKGNVYGPFLAVREGGRPIDADWDGGWPGGRP